MYRIGNPGLPDIAGEPDFYEISRKFPLTALPSSLHGQQPLEDAHGSDGHKQQDKLTLETLASFTPEVQKNMIRERLYPLIYQTQPELAGKITDRLLEIDNSEFLLHLLESPEALSSSIQDFLYLLSPDSDDTESLEEKALSGEKKAIEELKQRMREERTASRECGQKGCGV